LCCWSFSVFAKAGPSESAGCFAAKYLTQAQGQCGTGGYLAIFTGARQHYSALAVGNMAPRISTPNLPARRHAFESGDAALDREFGFSSDDSGRFLAWFQQPENNKQVVAMLHRDSDRCRLELTKGQLVWGIRGGIANEADLPPAQTDTAQGRFVPVRADSSAAEESERSQIREILEKLNQLASALENRL
jgi:hypothetical protein